MKLLRETDTALLWAVGAIILLGITMIYSASSGAAEWKKQALYAVLAAGALMAVIHIPNRLLYALAYPFYLGSMGMRMAASVRAVPRSGCSMIRAMGGSAMTRVPSRVW